MASTQGFRELPGRVTRLDRGWSTVLRNLDDEPLRMRNIGADVAVGDWVVPSAELDRVEAVLPRRSAFVRRASFEGSRAESQTIAANIDVVMLVHALTSPPNQRRLERELVLAWDSGARPVVVLTKRDLVDDPAASVESLHAAAPGVPILTASGITGEGVDALAAFRRRQRHHRPARRQWRRQEHVDQRARSAAAPRPPRRCARATVVAGTPRSRPSWFACPAAVG